MEPWLVVWLVVALVTVVALLGMLATLVRHVILLGRTAARVQEELRPIAEELATESAKAADAASRLSSHGPSGRGPSGGARRAVRR